jgi:hypothetical protein
MMVVMVMTRADAGLMQTHIACSLLVQRNKDNGTSAHVAATDKSEPHEAAIGSGR